MRWTNRRERGIPFGPRAAMPGMVALMLLVAALPSCHREAHGPACRARIMMLEQAIEVWEIDHEGKRLGAGNVAEASEIGRALVPAYLNKIPVCKGGGAYEYDGRHVSCTRHGTVDDPRW